MFYKQTLQSPGCAERGRSLGCWIWWAVQNVTVLVPAKECVLLEAAESTVAVFCTHMDIWSFCPLSVDVSFLRNVIWVSCLFMFTESNSTVFDHYIVSLKSSRYHPTVSVTLCPLYKARGLAQLFLGYTLTEGVKLWEINSPPYFVPCHMTGFLLVASCHNRFGFLPCNLAKLRPVAWRLLS